MYGRSKDGRGYVQAAKQAGLAPKASLHRKSVFT
jgi:hypothetical protein